MQVNFAFRCVPSSQALKSHAIARLERLARLLEQPVQAHVVFSLDRYVHQVTVQVQAGDAHVVGHGVTGDFYASVDEAFERIDAQLQKRREKRREHKRAA